MEDDIVYEALKRHAREVMPELAGRAIPPGSSLEDLGLDSIDRTEVVSLTMEDLSVVVPVTEFRGVDTVGELAALLRKHR